MSAFCEHDRVKTTCPACKPPIGNGTVSAVVAKVFELASSHPDWMTLYEGKPFKVSVIGGGLQFIPESKTPRSENRSRIAEAVMQLEQKRESGETPHRKHIESWATGSYILRLYIAVLWPDQYGPE